jgi:peptide chain release factor 1
VTDHRIGLTLHSLADFMEGDIGAMVGALLEADAAERLAELAGG